MLSRVANLFKSHLANLVQPDLALLHRSPEAPTSTPPRPPCKSMEPLCRVDARLLIMIGYPSCLGVCQLANPSRNGYWFPCSAGRPCSGNDVLVL